MYIVVARAFHGRAIHLLSRPPSPFALARIAKYSRPPNPNYSLLGFRVPFKVEPVSGPNSYLPLPPANFVFGYKIASLSGLPANVAPAFTGPRRLIFFATEGVLTTAAALSKSGHVGKMLIFRVQAMAGGTSNASALDVK